jgi:carbon-monoxide dehydrogenase medium subunit
MGVELYRPYSVEEACSLLAKKKGARPFAGGTDILSGRERGVPLPPTLICLDGLGLDDIRVESSGAIRVGPLVTHGAVARSPYFRSWYPVLADACASVGAPQVRNLGSLGGNLGNASPAADAASALLALGARLEIAGPGRTRLLPVEEFFLSPGRTVLERGEIISGIILPEPARRSAYLKLGRRKAMEIAVVGVAVSLEMEKDVVTGCRVGLAAVAPTPLRARQAEAALTGRALTPETVEQAARTSAAECSPVDDHRASADYRREMVRVLFRRAVRLAADRQEAVQADDLTALSEIGARVIERPAAGGKAKPIRSTRITLRVNGEDHTLEVAADRLLVDVLREDFGLTGTKKGCGEGECGTCTVLLEGMPVNACLVLAATVGNREIATVEGLSRGRELHPLQEAFVRHGAVQCGYCTPGMLMSGSALLQRNPRAGEQEIKEALSGNLCRCTGYKKIIEAVQAAGADLALK